MKIFVANHSEQKYGGGFSFIGNLRKALPESITDDYSAADIVLIPSASMIKPEVAEQAKVDGKKVVLRIDNALRNSRNQNKGMARMLRTAEVSDLVVYQSKWAKKYLRPFLGKDGAVILNSVDENIFHNRGRYDNPQTFIYSRFNRDETKGWEVARYYFSQESAKYPNSKLAIVGQFSPDLTEANFDFFMNEKYTYYGVQPLEAMADLYRQHKYFMYTYFNDACSNSLIEALLCGCRPVGPYFFRQTGGAQEILVKHNNKGSEYFHLKRMADEYRAALEAL